MTHAPAATSSDALLEDAVANIEARLAALGTALRERDTLAIESGAQALQRAFSTAIARFTAAARQADGVPLPLRRRLAVARAQVTAQRETLARANAALDRAMNVLLPPDWPAPAYAADGARTRQNTTGAIGA
jgi:hypothetical protein